MEEVYCYWRIAIPFFALNSKFEVPMFLRATAAVLMLATLNLSAQANNYPCSKSKRGVDHCSGEKFLCRDGSESSSAQKCTPASLQEFRSQWDFEDTKRSVPPAATLDHIGTHSIDVGTSHFCFGSHYRWRHD